MKIDRLTMEGRCDCGREIEFDRSPIHYVPMLVEETAKCGCGKQFHIHIQEINLQR